MLFPTTTNLALESFHNESGTASAVFGFSQLAVTLVVSAIIGLIQGCSVIPMAMALFFCALLSVGFLDYPKSRANKPVPVTDKGDL